VDTVFIPTSSSSSFLASRLIREAARYGGDVSGLVPEPVAKRLAEKFRDDARGQREKSSDQHGFPDGNPPGTDPWSAA